MHLLFSVPGGVSEFLLDIFSRLSPSSSGDGFGLQAGMGSGSFATTAGTSFFLMFSEAFSVSPFRHEQVTVHPPVLWVSDNPFSIESRPFYLE